MKTIYELFESDNLSEKEFEKQQKILKELNDVLLPFVEGSTLSNVEGTYANANLQQTATLYKSYGVGAISSALAGVIELA